MSRYLALALLLFAAALVATPAKADTIFTASLSGANEVPPTGSPAIGFISLTLSGDSLTVVESYSGLVGGPASAAHIHCCVGPGVNSIVALPFPAFPTVNNGTSGTYNNTFDLTLLSTYNSAFVTASGGTAHGAELALETGLFLGLAYANIHDTTFPGGEIRGELKQVQVNTPEPGTLLLLGMGLTGLLAKRKLRSA
jgi:hypothetical protein